MNKYRVEFTWSETVYYHSAIDVEAEDKDTAIEAAQDHQYDNQELANSEVNDDTETSVRLLTPIVQKKKVRNLP